MRQSFRAKLLVMLGILTLGFGVLIGVSSLVEQEVEGDLALIQERFIPLIVLGPKLEQGFERLSRGLQDAVAAQDVEALAETREAKEALLYTLRHEGAVLHPNDTKALADSVDSYYALAFDVSDRLIAGESGATLSDAILAMQAKQAQTVSLLRKAGSFDPVALQRAFAAASAAQRTATRVRIGVILGCLSVVLVVSLLLSRGLLRSLSALGRGLARFGRGEFDRRIETEGDEELAQLAHQANQMAESLQHTNAERDRQQERLTLMNAELVARGRELETVSSYKTQFLANMSHELRTPLNSMLVLSSLLAENEAGNLSPRQVEFCRTIHGAGKDLLSLINQVLDLSKIEAGRQDVVLGDVMLSALADYARRIFEPLAKDKGLSLEVTLDRTLPATIHSDKRRIEQILNNLLGNAIKFTERGSVGLHIGRVQEDAPLTRPELVPTHSLALSIRDTGPGIAPEHHGRVFAPFEQVDGSVDRRYGGTGLGLSIARELARLLGGEIQLTSAAGQGSTFTCYLPFAAPEQPEHEARPSVAPAPPPRVMTHTARVPEPPTDPFMAACLSAPPADLFRGVTLLIADDDMRTLYALSALLHAKGAEVLTADSGPSALSLLAGHPEVGAVLLDVMMPELDGCTVMRRIREDPRFADLPLIALTAKTRPEDRAECLAAGANAHVPKPVDADLLLRELTRLIDARTSRARPMAVGEERTWKP